MGYRIVGFYHREDGERVKEQLKDAGFNDIDYSKNEIEPGDYDKYDYSYAEDADTRSFWDKLFGTDTDDIDDNVVTDREVYSRVGSRADMLTVHVDTEAEADQAQGIMDAGGAIDPHAYDRSYSDYRTRYRSGEVTTDNWDEDYETYRKEWYEKDKSVDRDRTYSRRFDYEGSPTDNVRMNRDRRYRYSTYDDTLGNDFRRASWDY